MTAPGTTAPDAPAASVAMRQAPTSSRLVEAYAFVVLVLSTGAFFPLLVSQGESHPVVPPLWLLAYATAAALLSDGVFRCRRRPEVPALLLTFVLLAAASVLWSAAPTATLRRSIGLVGTVLVGLLLAERLTPVQILETVRRAVLVVAVVSLVVYVLRVPAAFDEVHGTLRGALSTKNALARVVGVGLFASACLAALDASRRRRAAVSAVPMVLALALSGSAAGTLVTALVLLLVLAVHLLRSVRGRRAVTAVAVVLAGLSVVVLPYASPAGLAGLIGRDATLTGRTEIWRLSLQSVQDRPLLGFGYGAFWHEDGPPDADLIRERLQYNVPHAHNGVLDAGLDLGMLGAALATALLAALLVRGWRDARRRRWDAAVLRLGVGALVLLANLAESSLLDENALLTVLMVTALAVRPSPPAVAVRA